MCELALERHLFVFTESLLGKKKEEERKKKHIPWYAGV